MVPAPMYRGGGKSSAREYELFTRMALYRMKILDYYFDGNLEEYMGLGYQ